MALLAAPQETQDENLVPILQDISVLTPAEQATYKLLVEAVARDELRERCKGPGGLKRFMKEFWGIVEPGRAFVDGWVVGAICLPYDSKILTDIGEKKIGDIVKDRWNGRVLTVNHSDNSLEWKKISEWMLSKSDDIFSITTEDGVTLTITGNHPIYSKERGYVRADKIAPGDTVLRILPERVFLKRMETDKILQPRMLFSGQSSWAFKAYACMQAMWRGILQRSVASAWRVLQYAVLWRIQASSRASYLPRLWGREGLGQQDLLGLLCEVAADGPNISVRRLWQAPVQDAGPNGGNPANLWGFLRPSLLRGASIWGKKCLLRRRRAGKEISAGILEGKVENTRKRRLSLFSLWVSLARATARPPYKSRENKQPEMEFGGSLSGLPLQTTSAQGSHNGTRYRIIESVVSHVKREIQVSREVYNIEVADNNNYFAENILVHNCEHLEAVTFGQINRLLINVPPGSTKSMTADVFFPAWEWGPMGLPMTRYMCASYNQHLTVRDNRRFRRLIMSTEYQEAWGDVFGPSADAFNIVLVGNDKTGWKLATSIGGTGVGERADRVIIDDGNNPLESESETVMESTAIWFREVIPDRLNHLEESAIINIQQRTSAADISGICLKEDLGYVHLMIPMEYDPSRHCVTVIGWEDPRGLGDDGEQISDYEREQRRGLLAWPERFSPEALTKLYRAKGEYAVAGQYQQMPTPRGGGIFKKEWIQSWPPLNPDNTFPQDMVDRFGRIRFPALEYICAWVDTAFTEKEENDFCAMSVVGIFRAEGKGTLVPNGDGTYKRVAEDHGYPKAIVMHAWQKRLTMHGPPQEIPPGLSLKEWNSKEYLEQRRRFWGLVEWVADTVKRFKVDYLGIETQAAGHTLQQELYREHRDLPCVIEVIPARGDKIARGYAVQGSFSSKQIFFPQFEDGGYPSWLDPLIDELFVFPKGDHDDLVDTLTGNIKHLRDIGMFDRREEWEREEEEAITYVPGQNRVRLPYEV